MESAERIWKKELEDVEREISKIEAQLKPYWEKIDPLIEQLALLKQRRTAILLSLGKDLRELTAQRPKT